MTFIVARFRDAPSSVLTFPPLLLPPSAFPPANVTMVGPHPSEEGRGTVGLKLRGQERAVAVRANVVVEVEHNHQPFIRLMIDSNSAPTRNHLCRS